jgi:hypothetical protein
VKEKLPGAKSPPDTGKKVELKNEAPRLKASGEVLLWSEVQGLTCVLIFFG